ncbi:protein Aster-B-like isoform X1 [Diorhabda sublineata]|uniref:protein Aster-B-like isoform X1 n=1 Tax=Diorhabda sublineata TaxID=1163346 RepID=UPI0024E0E399|nr:protein Aster-B-like isoform X1 [Diorhabda sublineata]
MKTNLSSSNIVAYDKQSVSSENKSVSPSSSPRSSPRPSPRPQSKRDHSKSDTYLSVSYKEQSIKLDGSPSSQDSLSSQRISNTNSIDITPPQDIKTDSTNSSKDRRESRGKKKSSWFNSLYPTTYKSKSEVYKKLFKDVPDDERLVVDYSCALQKDILHHGRLYVTQNYLCFYANIFGWETNLTLKWKDVASITKEKTAIVIPNAILISTKGDKYFFSSFVARDKTYLMLFRVWQNALMDQPMTAQEMWQWVHQCYGSELGLTSDDEDYVPPLTNEEDKLSVRLSVESFSEQEYQGQIIDGTMEQTSTTVYEKVDGEDIKIPTIMGHKRSGSDSKNPTDATDNSESETEKPIKKNFSFSFLKEAFTKETPPHTPPSPDSDGPHPNLDTFKTDIKVNCTCPHDGKQIINEVFPIHVDQLFTLLFTSSKFYLDFHAARKTTDLTQTPWTHNPIDNSKSRVVSLTVALLATMGPKSAQVTEQQTMNPCSKAGHLYSIDVESLNAGVPYADSFYVFVHYCLQKVSENQSSLQMFAQVKYKKSVWGLVKGMIERNAYSGIEDYGAHLTRALHAEGDDSIPEIKRKAKRKRRINSSTRGTIEENNPAKKKITEGIFSSEICTMIVFFVLILLLFLNVMLYYKLWSLEEAPSYNLLDLHLLKHPPQSHEEWITLLQQQEALHSVEAQKWQKLLRNSIQLLRQAEESLNELQSSIQSTYSSKLVSILQAGQEENKEEL